MRRLNLISVILCLTFLIISCGEVKDKPQNSVNETKQKEESGIKEPSDSKMESNKTERTSGDIRVKFPTGSTEVTLNGEISGFGQNITYVFEVSKGQKLFAMVKPASTGGNIRINQIITPSGSADGPFSNEITYALSENGDYKLVLGEDQMAGDPWKGEYFLTINIK